MDNAQYRLRPLEYEAVTGEFERLDRDVEPVLDEEQVARLLLGAPPRPSLAGEDERESVVGGAVDGDALAAMRGLMIGLAWMLPIWCVIAATISLI